MTTAKLITVAILAGILGLSALLFSRGPHSSGNATLVLHCAAGLRAPVTEIVAAYQEEYGVVVQPQFGGSGELASQLEIAGGDLYLPADDSYLHLAEEKGLLKQAFPLAHLTAGIAVRRGNPKRILTLADLTRPDIRLSLANPSAAIGKFTRQVLSESGHWDSVRNHATVFKFTVTDCAQDVAIGAVDATILWDAVVETFENLDFVPLSAFEERPRTAALGVLKATDAPDAALHFARYLSASDRGLSILRKHGFQVIEGKAWESEPRA